MARDVKYEDIKIGDKASVSKTISEFDVYAFAGVTNSMFKQRIAHGMISAGLISAVLGTELPGVNTIYMNQSLSFLAPVFYGDTLTATVECKEKDDAKHRIIFKTTVTNQDGKVVTDGEARVMKK